jgi:hypothetical protein
MRGEKISCADLEAEINEQFCSVSNALAVLREATGYFEKPLYPGSTALLVLAGKQDHILKLFYAVDDMLTGVEAKQNEIIESLYRLCHYRSKAARSRKIAHGRIKRLSNIKTFQTERNGK